MILLSRPLLLDFPETIASPTRPSGKSSIKSKSVRKGEVETVTVTA